MRSEGPGGKGLVLEVQPIEIENLDLGHPVKVNLLLRLIFDIFLMILTTVSISLLLSGFRALLTLLGNSLMHITQM